MTNASKDNLRVRSTMPFRSCLKCGSNLNLKDGFCTNCGTKIIK